MVNRTSVKKYQTTASRFRLKPLVSGVQLVLAGGMLACPAAHAELPVPMPGQGWVSSGSASLSNPSADALRIDQHTDRAILNWQSFNVGKENTVQFVQPSSSSIALNRINQQDPSRIFGQIVANGQVYLYNSNGFVFGKDAVVNTNSFLASTLNITDEVFNRGITRVYDEDGRAALAVENGLSDNTAQILIEAGAKISVDKAGRIILAAPNINNQGSLSAGEQGQIIVAASQDKVYLQAADEESPFAGLLVEVDTGGQVTNAGDIGVRQGNVTLAGFAVNQQGRITATTSVNVNGSIRLLAQEKQANIGGKLAATRTTRDNALADGMGTESSLTFSEGSLTQVVADRDGGSAIDEQAQAKSYIEATGHTISMESGSAIVAPSARVDITATNNLQSPLQGDSGRIHIDDGALIDVSGSENVAVAMERNVAEISVQSFELRDAPVQKTGPLKGETVKIDLRKGSQIVDTSGAEARISRGIDERLGTGGEINLSSAGDVIVNAGATIDISGGSVAYQGGFIQTTQLMDVYGRIVDISVADPNQTYVSVFGTVSVAHEKWGQTREWSISDRYARSRYEAGYTEGLDAGSLNIKTAALAWNGQLLAGSPNGIYQRQDAQRADGGSFVFDTTAFVSTLQQVRFQTESSLVDLALEEAFPQTGGQPQTLILPRTLTNGSGLQHLQIKTLANVTVDENARIDMVAGGEFSIQAGSIDVLGQVHSAGGDIDLAIADSLLGGITLGSKSVLDVSGRWVNDYALGFNANPIDPIAIDGGSVTVNSVADLNMRAGSSIKANGGGWLDQRGHLRAGDGGSIELVADGQGVASRLYFDGTVSAVALGKGGKLTLGSSEIVIGDGAAQTADPLRLAVSDGRFAFDRQGGFAEINLLGTLEGVTVGDGTQLNLRTANMELLNGYAGKASGSDLSGFTRMVVLPEHLRQGNALNIAAMGDVKLGTGSAIDMDKQGSVTLTTNTGGIYVDGRINVPGGNIRLAIDALAGALYDATQSVRLGQNARLLARGDVRLDPRDALGRQNGEVLDGGSVSFDLERGSLIFEAGSIVDVSGTHTVLDLPAAGGLGATTLPVRVFGDAGSIDIKAAESAVFDGKFVGLVSSDGARGGRFSFELDRTRRLPPDDPLLAQLFPNNGLTVRIRNEQSVLFDSAIGFGDAIPQGFIGNAVLAADMLEAGGFTDVRLKTADKILFEGEVSLDAAARIELDAATIDWAALNGEASADVSLNSALISLGASLQRQTSGQPVAGNGVFSANAQWIELFGATRWDGFASLSLNSVYDLRTRGLRFGDQRDFLGGLTTAADLNLKAAQIYPTTLSQFTFKVANNANGKISVASSGKTLQTPLSAAGTLIMEAPVIEQDGVLKAPLGSIQLKAGTRLSLGDGSLTSVSGDGQTVPFGVVQAGLDWLYPLDTIRNLVFDTPPEKKLLLEAPELLLEQGSVVNLSGGGNLQAYEFLPGAGGSYDYLNPNSPAYEGGFAIMPALGSELAPFDHYENTLVGWAYETGSKVYLSGSDIKGLAAGEYVILPAHYALLPGAFLITPQASSRDQVATTFTTQGLPVVSGYFTDMGTGTRDARWSGFKIENGADVRLRSEYELHNADSYYSAKALVNETAVPLLPMDSGQISLLAQTRLVLESQFEVDAVNGGRGARMDIAANKIRVVNQSSGNPEAGVLEISADELSDLGVDSLLLGGSRSRNAATGETQLNVSAQEVVFAENSRIQGKDLLAAATQKVEVESGAVLSAQGPVNAGDSVFNVAGNGAFLRVSGDEQVTLNRSGANSGSGQLIIAAGASLEASKSMLLDASQATLLQGDILMRQGSLSLSAGTINLGEVDNVGGSALNLSNGKLLNLSVDELILTARDAIGIYGNLGLVDENGAAVIGEGGLQEAIRFNRLVIDSAGLVGHGDAGDRARIRADSLRLQNTRGVANQQVVDGQGQIDLSGDTIEIGQGDWLLKGFDSVNLQADTQLRADGDAVVDVAADLNVAAPFITAKGGADLAFNMAGYDARFSGSAAGREVSSGFGASFAVTADSIDFNSRLLLPSGTVAWHALNGDVGVGAEAVVDLAGRAVSFADSVDYTPGGRFTAASDTGQVVLAAGSLLDLDSGGGDAAGGSLNLSAPSQGIVLAGTLRAAKGSASLDIQDFSAGGGFDSLMQTLSDAGISESLYFRTRGGDAAIVQGAGSTIKAHDVILVADKAAITLAGHIDADGVAAGGTIGLFAGDAITLQNGAMLTATGVKGGKVLLSSTDDDADAIAGIAIQAGSLIDVAGATATEGGEVTLRALRNGNGIDIQPIAGSVSGFAAQAAVYDSDSNLIEYAYSGFFAEGVKKYVDADGILNASDFAAIQGDTAAYMSAANMQGVSAGLGGGIRLRAGVDVSYAGNLALNDKWDLAAWRYSEGGDLVPMPGTLTIRAGGDLSINQSLSDGFADGVIPTVLGDMPAPGEVLQSGESWSYRLTAGADLSSAYYADTVADKDLDIGSGASVRTGTGDIKAAAGGDIRLADQTSTLYSAGRSTRVDPYGGLGLFMAFGQLDHIEYPLDGGDISLRAGGNIVGAASNQFLNGWLQRQGNNEAVEDAYLAGVAADLAALKDDSAGLAAYKAGLPLSVQAHITEDYKLDTKAYETPITWGVKFADFQQNIGSFGGGNVSVHAGKDVENLSVMLPTTAKQIGDPAFDANLNSVNFLSNVIDVQGGGNLRVDAGGDIKGGAYMVANGEGRLSAGGAITSGSQFTQGVQLLLGDGRFDLQANKQILLAGVSDPMILHSGDTNFFSYADDSAISARALSGNVQLNANIDAFTPMLNPVPNQATLALVYPGSLNATAFGGSVVLAGDVVLFPAPRGSVNILAEQDFKSAAAASRLAMSDADRALLPAAMSPVARSNMSDAAARINPFGLSSFVHAATPVHAGDAEPVRIVTRSGDIDNVQLNLAKKAVLQTGGDFKNTLIWIQHANPNDGTVFNIGRDLKYTSNRDLNGQLVPNINEIKLAGAGELLIKTGRHLDLGAAVGISTVGDLTNPALADSGATVSILVGLNGREPAYVEFIETYLMADAGYAAYAAELFDLITVYMRNRLQDPGLDSEAAWTAFKMLDANDYLTLQPQLNALIVPVYMNEIKESGSAAAGSGQLGNERGYAAIETLFPGTDWRGDLSLFFSKIHTLDDGGINLFVPGGQINAGLAVGTDAKEASDLGIVAQRAGDINAVLLDDFLVNQSRVFSLAGGDIVLWSSEGDLNAGAGAKSSIAAPPPRITFDENGNLVIVFPPIVSGSGIRTAAEAGKVPGDVYLFAPKGVVDAGEAGIGGSNVTISATAVLGANNIQVSGIGTGVPVASTGSLAAGLTGAGNLTAAVSQMAESSVGGDVGKDTANALAKAVMGILSVEVIGFGE